MLADLDRAFDTARRTARGEQGQICLGYTSAAAFHPLVPRIIREFRRAFPAVSLTLEENPPNDRIEGLLNNEIDIAFIGGPIPDQAGVTVDRLLEDPMVVALPRGHPLARGYRTLSLKSLADETFIVFGRPNSPSTMQTNAVVVACQAAGFSPRIGHVVPNNLSRLNLVAANLGIAIIAASLQRMKLDGVVYRRLRRAKQLKISLILAFRHAGESAAVLQFRAPIDCGAVGLAAGLRQGRVNWSNSGEVIPGPMVVYCCNIRSQ
jgi:DNA-binding transcriptional LysR family regulator